MNKKQLYYIGLVGVLVAILCMQQCNISRMKSDIQMREVNMRALQDTITVTKNRVGQLQYEKSVFVTSEKGLKDLNADLAKEVSAQKGTIAFLQKIVSTISTDHGGPIAVIPVPDDSVANPCDSVASYTLPWRSDADYDSLNFRRLRGELRLTMEKGSIVSTTSQILQDQISFDIVTGLEKKEDHYEIFVRSNYPGFAPSRIDGAFIPRADLFPPDKKRWVIGPNMSGGLGVGGTSLNNMGPVIYVGVGLGVTYRVIAF